MFVNLGKNQKTRGHCLRKSYKNNLTDARQPYFLLKDLESFDKFNSKKDLLQQLFQFMSRRTCIKFEFKVQFYL